MIPTIRNWTVVKAEGNMYIKGYVFNHPNKNYAADGDLILTSAIIDGGNGRIIAQDGVYILEA